MAPRLRTLAPRIGGLPPRIGALRTRPDGTVKARRSRASWKAWYSTARWLNLRTDTFERDGYICQRTGVMCAGVHPAPDSPVANHKIRHNGDPALFWDPDNLETVTKAVHDSLIQAEEARAYQRGEWD